VTAGLNIGGPVRGERTADVVARRLAQAILGGEIAPGTRLREEDLARTFSVSRTPVREALIVLSATGLAHLEANRGATVLQLTAGDVSEVYHLRAVLESESAAMAAARISAELAGLLFKICDRMGELHEAPASEQLAADTQFHYTIAEASGVVALGRPQRRPERDLGAAGLGPRGAPPQDRAGAVEVHGYHRHPAADRQEGGAAAEGLAPSVGGAAAFG